MEDEFHYKICYVSKKFCKELRELYLKDERFKMLEFCSLDFVRIEFTSYLDIVGGKQIKIGIWNLNEKDLDDFNLAEFSIRDLVGLLFESDLGERGKKFVEYVVNRNLWNVKSIEKYRNQLQSTESESVKKFLAEIIADLEKGLILVVKEIKSEDNIVPALREISNLLVKYLEEMSRYELYKIFRRDYTHSH